jgi:hypothetical protein
VSELLGAPVTSREEIEKRLDVIERSGTLRVRARESTDLEFKLELNENVFKKCLKTIAAFSNKNGGIIVFGVRDKPRNLDGLNGNFLDEGVQSSLIAAHLAPIPQTYFQVEEIAGKEIGILTVYPLAKKPCIACKDLSGGQGEKQILKQGVIYARRRGQTDPISSNEFVQLLSERDDSIRSEIFDFLKRGRSVGFERAIIADAAVSDQGEQLATYFLPAEAAKNLNVIDRARIVSDGAAPAYEIQGNIELTVPSENDPREPLLPKRSAEEIAGRIREVTLVDLPFTYIHLRKIADHLNFWANEYGDGRHTGFDHIAERPVYYREGRQAVVDFAKQNPKEFLEVCASKQNLGRWLALNGT